MAETQDLQKLIISLEARTAAFEKQMARAERIAATKTKQIESRFNKMQAGISASFAGLNKGLAMFGLGAIGTAAFASILGEAKRITQWADDLVDLSEQTGIAVDELQVFQELAERTGSSTEVAAKGLGFFTRELGEASTKTNELAQLLDINGIALRNQDGSLREVDAVLHDVITLIGRFTTAQERARAAAIAFGAGQDELGETFSEGMKGVENVSKAMDELGTKITPEKAAQLAEYNEQIRVMAAIFEAFKVNAVIAIGEAIGFLADNWKVLSAVLSVITGNPGAMLLLGGEIFADQAAAAGEAADNHAALNEQLEKTNREIEELAEGPDPSLVIDDETARNAEIMRQEEMNRLLQERADIEYDLNHVLEKRKQIAKEKLTEDLLNPPGTVPATEHLEGIPREDFESRFEGTDLAIPEDELPPPLLPDPEAAAEAEAAAREATRAAEQQAEAIARVSENLQFERDQLGRTAREQEIYNALKAAGVDINSAAGQQIAELAGALYDEEQALQAVITNMDLLRTSAKDFTETLVSGLAEGADATEVLGDAVKRLADRLISSGIDQLFNLLLGMPGTPGFLGAIFGRASGGPVNPGQVYKVHKDELIVPRVPMNVIPASQVKGDSGVALNYAPSIVIQGNADESAIRFMRDRILIDVEQRLPGMVRKAHSNRTL